MVLFGRDKYSVTTDNEQRPQLLGALNLDIGVAGTEILSSSRDLVPLPVKDDVGVCSPIGTRREFLAQRWQAQTCASRASSAYTATCKHCETLALWRSQICCVL